MTSKTLLVALMASSIAFTAMAQEEQNEQQGKTAIKAEELAPKNEVKGDDIDQEITNRKLRAETGSKSKYSISTDWTYNGGTIKDPGSDVRPNVRAASSTPTMASLTGSVGVKYRMTERDSMSFGVGLRMFTPFHQDITETKVSSDRGSVNRNDVSNPSLGYSRLYKTGGIQNVTSVAATVTTTDYAKQVGMDWDLSASQTMVYDINGFSMGVLIGGGNTFYSDFSAAAKANSSDYYIGVYPFLEYVINDTFNLRTISGVWVYEHYRDQDAMTFSKNAIYQSVGLGISVTRDIYLYPNVQFVPENIRDDLTNVALTAYINVF